MLPLPFGSKFYLFYFLLFKHHIKWDKLSLLFRNLYLRLGLMPVSSHFLPWMDGGTIISRHDKGNMDTCKHCKKYFLQGRKLLLCHFHINLIRNFVRKMNAKSKSRVIKKLDTLVTQYVNPAVTYFDYSCNCLTLVSNIHFFGTWFYVRIIHYNKENEQAHARMLNITNIKAFISASSFLFLYSCALGNARLTRNGVYRPNFHAKCRRLVENTVKGMLYFIKCIK